MVSGGAPAFHLPTPPSAARLHTHTWGSHGFRLPSCRAWVWGLCALISESALAACLHTTPIHHYHTTFYFFIHTMDMFFRWEDAFPGTAFGHGFSRFADARPTFSSLPLISGGARVRWPHIPATTAQHDNGERTALRMPRTSGTNIQPASLQQANDRTRATRISPSTTPPAHTSYAIRDFSARHSAATWRASSRCKRRIQYTNTHASWPLALHGLNAATFSNRFLATFPQYWVVCSRGGWCDGIPDASAAFSGRHLV